MTQGKTMRAGLQCLSAVCPSRTGEDFIASLDPKMECLQCLSAVCPSRTIGSVFAIPTNYDSLQCLSAVCPSRTRLFRLLKIGSLIVFSAFRRFVQVGLMGS